MNATDQLQQMLDWFPGGDQLIARSEHIPSSQTPEPYKALLVHDHHMTVTMEQFHRTPVRVKVLARRREGDIYLRHIVLERCDNGRVVQFGIVRFDFRYVTDEVRDQILAEQTPLGRILINFNVLRHIDLGAIVRIWPGPQLQTLFGCPAEPPLYGRLATIFCNQKPAVDLLEISAPVTTDATA